MKTCNGSVFLVHVSTIEGNAKVQISFNIVLLPCWLQIELCSDDGMHNENLNHRTLHTGKMWTNGTIYSVSCLATSGLVKDRSRTMSMYIYLPHPHTTNVHRFETRPSFLEPPSAPRALKRWKRYTPVITPRIVNGRHR